jgi:hypothetical protein
LNLKWKKKLMHHLKFWLHVGASMAWWHISSLLLLLWFITFSCATYFCIGYFLIFKRVFENWVSQELCMFHCVKYKKIEKLTFSYQCHCSLKGHDFWQFSNFLWDVFWCYTLNPTYWSNCNNHVLFSHAHIMWILSVLV